MNTLRRKRVFNWLKFTILSPVEDMFILFENMLLFKGIYCAAYSDYFQISSHKSKELD